MREIISINGTSIDPSLATRFASPHNPRDMAQSSLWTTPVLIFNDI
jgi:hypothetical protein